MMLLALLCQAIIQANHYLNCVFTSFSRLELCNLKAHQLSSTLSIFWQRSILR